MNKTAQDRANIAQRKMNVKQGRLMAIFEALGHPPTEEEVRKAHEEAAKWVDAHTDAEGNVKPNAPSIRSGLEAWRNG